MCYRFDICRPKLTEKTSRIVWQTSTVLAYLRKVVHGEQIRYTPNRPGDSALTYRPRPPCDSANYLCQRACGPLPRGVPCHPAGFKQQ